MEGIGKRGVLGVESPDPVLSMLSSLGLALSAVTALVVDLGGDVRTPRTLADLAEHGPSISELSPGRSGVALIGGGGLAQDVADEVITSLSANWPAVVVRCPVRLDSFPSVPVRALLPGLLESHESRPAVWQSCGVSMSPPGPGPVLPVTSPGLVRNLLAGGVPRRSRWMTVWDRVWEMPWG